jgi:hypothetical protein
MLEVVDDLLAKEQHRNYFAGLSFPYAFLAPEKYSQLLIQAGLEPLRVKLIDKDRVFGYRRIDRLDSNYMAAIYTAHT